MRRRSLAWIAPLARPGATVEVAGEDQAAVDKIADLVEKDLDA